jgi:hypothetical protein
VHVLVARDSHHQEERREIYNHVTGYDPIVLAELKTEKVEFWYHSQRMRGLADKDILPSYDLSPLVNMWRKELCVDKVRVRWFNTPISCVHCGSTRVVDRSNYAQENSWRGDVEISVHENLTRLTDGYGKCSINAIYESGREEILTERTLALHPTDFPKEDTSLQINRLLEVCYDCRHRKVRSLRSSIKKRYSLWSKPIEQVTREYIDQMPAEWWRCRSAFSQEFAKKLPKDNKAAIRKSINRHFKRYPNGSTTNLLKMLAMKFKGVS